MSLKQDEMIAERYQIDTMLRRGSVSELWTAYDVVLKRQVALRIVKQEMLSNHAYLTRFEKDSQFVASLEHPHIVPMHDYGIYNNRPYQVQRMVGVDSLLTWYFQQKKPIKSSILLRIAQQLASAIDFMHQRGVVHRAISANTIILDEENQPYLINFTVAKRLDDDTPQANAERYAVLSPEEQAGASPDRSSDIYAFGLLLYSLFTGEREPQYEYNEVVSHVRDFRPDLPIGVDVVVSRLLHPNPQQRYQSALDAIDDLSNAFYSGQQNIDGQLFISYARKDSAYVYSLAQQLRHIGLDIWIDQDIEPSKNWDNAIEQALKDCSKMLLIVSPASMRSENVQDEWSYFLEEGKPVYSFIHQETEMSFRLRRRQYITSTDDLLNDVARIVAVLAGGNPTKLRSLSDDAL